jgi:cytochrome bd-type quinol oxidase subunit 2
MNDYLRTALSGWAAFLLFVAGLLLPYLIRRTRSRDKPILKRLWPHYWIGYALPAVAFVHAWLPMRTGNMKGVNMTGLWLATIALVLIAFQVVIGLQLRNPTQSGRRQLRATHFWTMALLAGLIIVHIAINRP